MTAGVVVTDAFGSKETTLRFTIAPPVAFPCGENGTAVFGGAAQSPTKPSPLEMKRIVEPTFASGISPMLVYLKTKSG